jgi:hypothetical protein
MTYDQQPISINVMNIESIRFCTTEETIITTTSGYEYQVIGKFLKISKDIEEKIRRVLKR